MTKEEILKEIKAQMPQWTDEQCLAFYEQEERMQGEIETAQVWYAYYSWNEETGRRRYGVATEEDFDRKKICDKAYDYRRCYSKKAAEEQLREWKNSFRY